MNTEKYLKQKYGMFDDARVPIEFIQEELFIDAAEAKRLVRAALKRKHCPMMIKFREFKQIVQDVLG